MFTRFKPRTLDSSKLEEFADDKFKFDENCGKFSKGVENTIEKGKIACCFSHSVFKTLVQQTRKNKGLFAKGFTQYQSTKFIIGQK